MSVKHTQLKQWMHFWFFKMLWSTEVENRLENQGGHLRTNSRAHSMAGIWKEYFSTEKQTKQNKNCSSGRWKPFRMQASWNIQIEAWSSKDNTTLLSGKLQWREKMNKKCTGRAPEFGCPILLHASLCFLRLFKRKLKEFSSCFKPKGSEKTWTVWIRSDIT